MISLNFVKRLQLNDFNVLESITKQRATSLISLNTFDIGYYSTFCKSNFCSNINCNYYKKWELFGIKNLQILRKILLLLVFPELHTKTIFVESKLYHDSEV